MEGILIGMKQMYTKEEVSKTLKKIGYLPLIKIDQHPDLPSHTTIKRLFKTTSMANVWKELSIPFIPLPCYTKEEVSKALNKTGYLSRRKIDQHPDLPSLSTVLKLFKTTKISDAWNELGIPAPYTKEEVSKALKEIGYLKAKEIDQHPDLPSRPTVLKLFKTTKINNVWNELDIPITPKPSYAKEEVAKVLKETGYLTQKKIDQHPDLPAHTTVLRLFKATSMDDVWEELDIDIFGI